MHDGMSAMSRLIPRQVVGGLPALCPLLALPLSCLPLILILAPRGVPTSSTVARVLTNQGVLVGTLISSVTSAASPSTRRLSVRPISPPDDTRKPPRLSLEPCQLHPANVKCAGSNLHIQVTSPSMKQAAHTVSGSKI